MRAHLVRSFVSALYYAGALALIAGLLSDNTSLLLVLITFGILTRTFSNSIQSLLDTLTLPQKTTDERQALRETAAELVAIAAGLEKV